MKNTIIAHIENEKEFIINLDVTVSIADLRVMEDFVMEYTDPSVIEQALEDIADSDREEVYRKTIIEEFLRESILRASSENT